VVNGAEKLFFTTEEELRLAETTFTPYRPKRTIVTGLGVTSPPPFERTMTERFYENCPAAKGSAYLLFLGRIHPKKGIDILLKAYNTVLQNNSETGDRKKVVYKVPHLVIAGPGWDGEHGTTLKQYINEHPILKERVHLVNMINGPAKWGAFYNADAYILTSHQENFGISIVEALACEKPVIITRQINIWKEIIENNGGLSGNSSYNDTLINLQKWIELDEQTKTLMSGNAKKIFDKFFSDKTVGLRFSNAIN
jgi:glycosyltransferase involved in cell wall biosynthesis